MWFSVHLNIRKANINKDQTCRYEMLSKIENTYIQMFIKYNFRWFYFNKNVWEKSINVGKLTNKEMIITVRTCAGCYMPNSINILFMWNDSIVHEVWSLT